MQIQYKSDMLYFFLEFIGYIEFSFIDMFDCKECWVMFSSLFKWRGEQQLVCVKDFYIYMFCK